MRLAENEPVAVSTSNESKIRASVMLVGCGLAIGSGTEAADASDGA
jgi:hypothetical protein